MEPLLLSVDERAVLERRRFIAERLDGLGDEPRPGRPPTISVDQVQAVVVTTLERLPITPDHLVGDVRGSSALARGGSFFLGCGQVEFTAFLTVRYVTPYSRSRARIDWPARWSRRIAAYSLGFDTCGMTSTFHHEHPDAALASTAALSKLLNITRPGKGVPPKVPAYPCQWPLAV